MGVFPRTVQAGFVWLTAILTGVAGAPHLDCICPNGQHKPFCLGSPSKTTSCCCGGGCCSQAAGACCGACRKHDAPKMHQAEAKSCCGPRHGPKGSIVPGKSSQIASRCCHRAPAQAETLAVTSSKETVPESRVAQPLSLAPDAPDAAVRQLAGSWQPSWQHYRLPPPTDRIISFCHFVI